jgi:hypothetical protein
MDRIVREPTTGSPQAIRVTLTLDALDALLASTSSPALKAHLQGEQRALMTARREWRSQHDLTKPGER